MKPEDPERPPPEGFDPATRRGPFTQHNGPFYVRPCAVGVEQGFYALRRHCNGFGIVHGGMLASFMDGLLAHAVSTGAGVRAVTIHLSLDYLTMGRAGEWIQGQARLTRRTPDVAFAEGRVFVGSSDLVRASGIFKLMDRRRPSA